MMEAFTAISQFLLLLTILYSQHFVLNSVKHEAYLVLLTKFISLLSLPDEIVLSLSHTIIIQLVSVSLTSQLVLVHFMQKIAVASF